MTFPHKSAVPQIPARKHSSWTIWLYSTQTMNHHGLSDLPNCDCAYDVSVRDDTH